MVICLPNIIGCSNRYTGNTFATYFDIDHFMTSTVTTHTNMI